MRRLLRTILAAALVTAAPSAARAATVIVGFPPGNPHHGDTFAVDVSVDVGTSVLGSYDFRLEYDPLVVHVMSIGGGLTAQFAAAPTTDPATFATGSTRFVAAQGNPSAPKGVVSVATVTFLAVGDPRNQSNLDVAVNGLFDGAAAPLPSTVVGSNVLIAFMPSDPLTTTTTSTSTSTSSSTSTSTSSSTSLPPTTTTSTSTSTSVTTSSRPTTTSTSSSSSTSVRVSTTTVTSTPTPTTVPTTAAEVCGNCVDDDGNAATDYEDLACCAQPAAMQVTKGRFVAKSGKPGQLKLVSILATSGLADVNPTTDDVTIQFRNASGELLCTNVGHGLWRKKKKSFVFKDPSGSAAGLTTGEIRPLPNGSVRFTASGKHVDLSRFDTSSLGVTVRVGARCSRGSAPLRQKGKGLVFP